MQLVFLLIFLIFVFLNVILGLVSSRKKKKRLTIESQREDESGQGRTDYNMPDQMVFERSGPVTLESSDTVRQEEQLPEAAERIKSRPEKSPGIAEETATRPRVQEVHPAEVYPYTGYPKEAVSFLHEQTADSIPVPRYSLAAELKPAEESSRSSAMRGSILEIQTDIQPEPPKLKPVASAIKKLEAIPPLKRAIVFSEILGTPKGLSGF
jgi:hypothetical protein